MKFLLRLCAVFVAMFIAPISAAALEEARASYVAIEYIGVSDKPVATVVITADAAIAAPWEPSVKNARIYLYIRAYLLDAEAYAKVHDFFAREAAKRNGKMSSMDMWGSYEISSRARSGEINKFDNPYTLPSGDKKILAMPLNAKESRAMLRAFVKYLSEQGIDEGLQAELADWR